MKRINLLKYILLLFLSHTFGSCVFEKLEEVNTGGEPVKVDFSTRAFTENGVTISSFRLIAFNMAGSLEINKTLDDLFVSDNNLTLDLRPGVYTLFAVGNELADMTPALDGATSVADVDAIRINGIVNMDSTSLPVAWKKTIYVRQKSAGSNIGQLSLNNKDWHDRMNMETERLAAKLEFYIRKEGSLDFATLNSVTPVNLPEHSFLTASPYSGQYFSERFGDQFVPLSDDFTLILNRIYPEHIPATADKNTFVELDIWGGKDDVKAIIQVGKLERNKLYRYEILYKDRTVVVENIQVLPWNPVDLDESVDGVEINFSRTEVPYSYKQENRVYFTTKNMPEANLTLSEDVYLVDGSQAHLSSLFDETVTKINYTYDETTKLGSGYLSIKRKRPSPDMHKLRINASGITKEVLVNGVSFAGSNVYYSQEKNRLTFDDTAPDGISTPGSSFVGVLVKYGGLAAFPVLPVGYYDRDKISFIWSSTGETALSDNNMESDIVITSNLMNSMSLDADRGVGDLCEYMTRRGYAPKNKKWRYPESKEIDFVCRCTEVSNSEAISPNGDFAGNELYHPISRNLTFPNSFVVQPNPVFIQVRSEAAYSTFYDSFGTGGIGYYLYYSVSVFLKPRYPDTTRSTTVTSNSGPGPQFAFYNGLRCVVDDSPGEVIPLYMLSYDLSGGEAGTITVPTPEGMIKNQHADPGGFIRLSNVVLTSSAGRIHNGWIINGKEYELGGVVLNIQSDMIAKPRWIG